MVPLFPRHLPQVWKIEKGLLSFISGMQFSGFSVLVWVFDFPCIPTCYRGAALFVLEIPWFRPWWNQFHHNPKDIVRSNPPKKIPYKIQKLLKSVATHYSKPLRGHILNWVPTANSLCPCPVPLTTGPVRCPRHVSYVGNKPDTFQIYQQNGKVPVAGNRTHEQTLYLGWP